MKKKMNVRWQLVGYDLVILLVVDLLLLVFSGERLSVGGTVIQFGIAAVCMVAARMVGQIYRQIWRYGGIQCYIRLILTDAVAFVMTFLVERALPIEHITFSRLSAIACMNLLGALAMRMFYRYAFKCGNESTPLGRFLLLLLKLFAGENISGERELKTNRTKMAIIGAGRVGVSLAEELLNNAASAYTPICFVDVSAGKAGRDIHGIPVLPENDATLSHLKDLGVQEVVGCRDNRTNRKMPLNLGSL